MIIILCSMVLSGLLSPPLIVLLSMLFNGGKNVFTP